MYGRFNQNSNMILRISDEKTLASVQADFNEGGVF
jgi:hypothetical protein